VNLILEKKLRMKSLEYSCSAWRLLLVLGAGEDYLACVRRPLLYLSHHGSDHSLIDALAIPPEHIRIRGPGLPVFLSPSSNHIAHLSHES
jgi:hypothetical protein